MIITIIQGIIFLSYIFFLVYRFGVLPSISESHYRLNDLRKSYLFTLFCWALSVLMIFQTNETSPLFFISATGLAFVGSASEFKWTGAFTNIVHYGGALLGIGGALMGLWIEYNNLIPLLAFISIGIVLSALNVRNIIWWVEIVAFVCIISGLLYRFA